MRILPLSEGSFTVDATKVFIPFNKEAVALQERTKGSILVEVQPFVVITEKDIILLDTGLGQFAPSGNLQIHENLMSLGINPSQVTKVFMSHLHKDHASAISYVHPEHQERFISFPYAHYYVQRKEFEFAMEGNKSSYEPASIEILNDYSKTVWLDQSEGTIDGTIHYQLTGAHSKFHQVCWIQEEGETLFFGGDVAPQLQQMKSRFIAKYDYDGKLCMELRQSWWEKGKTEGWEFAFYHDIKSPRFKPTL